MIGSADELKGGRLYETEKTPEAVVLDNRKAESLAGSEQKRKESLIVPVDVVHPAGGILVKSLSEEDGFTDVNRSISL